jgi:hypothetical protein
MADLDEFLKPVVIKDLRPFFENPLETVWVIPFTAFIPPNGDRRPDEYCTTRKEVGEKAQQILDAGFHFTSELLRSVNKMVFYITGQVQETEEDDPEEGDASMQMSGPGKQFFDTMDAWIMAFEIPEDGIYRRWKPHG